MLAAADQDFVRDYLGQSVDALQTFASDPAHTVLIDRMAGVVVDAIRAGGKLMLVGNGGSAGDAQHLAAEFTGRMLYDRDPLPAMALHCDTSALTGVGNDYGYEKVFERQVVAMGRAGDVLLALSTSGTSPNVVRALDAARARGLVTLGFTGQHGGAMAERTDLLLRVPSRLTPVIQQVYMVAGHLLCCLVERAIYPKA